MFHFYEPPFGNPPSHHSYLVATLASGIESTKRLVTAAGVLLGFPPHFGKNFDAFWDCLRDLPKEPKPVALVHQDLPKIGAEELEIYLELLRDADLYWCKHQDEHLFEVWFPKSEQQKVEEIMKDIPPPDGDELE